MSSALPCAAIDAHHHLWHLGEVHYPWLMARGERRFFGDPTPIQRDYGIAEFSADIGSLPVRASVHVQVGAADALQEAEWVEHQCAATAYQRPAAQVAFCDLAAPDRDVALTRLARLRSVRGVRQIVGREAAEDARSGAPSLLDNPHWRAGLGELARRGLSFDLQLVPEQMIEAADALATVPDLQVALCHCGSPWERSGEGFRRWQQGIRRLAALPGVHCKISGLGMFDPGWTPESMRGVFETVVDAFGPARCMFGSNFPVDRLHRGYRDCWLAFADLARELNYAAVASLFHGTASRFYRLAQLPNGSDNH